MKIVLHKLKYTLCDNKIYQQNAFNTNDIIMKFNCHMRLFTFNKDTGKKEKQLTSKK